eukprot:1068146-Prorocentrum_lima.AAC.1
MAESRAEIEATRLFGALCPALCVSSRVHTSASSTFIGSAHIPRLHWSASGRSTLGLGLIWVGGFQHHVGTVISGSILRQCPPFVPTVP